ncbi:DUF1330 domain-containing protein [Shewanella zhangzhouensis]|uniref:DUF1330 domain-containing protein n=1 Tax=Shewanella zhangzhouensis TaxID=2864213 RepID=UPI001C65C4E0|nr:DUF1330 domain-containing protein [Shewanella zhangzhouensis]QYK07015.1 DUF1330 domain-containing protein [Shewanella zhangzhouensis]
MSNVIYTYIDFIIKDEYSFSEYSKLVPLTVKQYGGETLAVQKQTDFPIGGRDVQVQIIQRWPSRDSFDAWHSSPEYAPLKEIRDNRAICNLNISILQGI